MVEQYVDILSSNLKFTSNFVKTSQGLTLEIKKLYLIHLPNINALNERASLTSCNLISYV